MTKEQATIKGWQPTANYYAGSQIWIKEINGIKKYALYSPGADHLSII